MLAKWLTDERRSQQWLAQQLGVAQGSVSDWLGHSQPRIEYGMKLAEITGIPIAAWTEPVEEPKRSKKKAA